MAMRLPARVVAVLLSSLVAMACGRVRPLAQTDADARAEPEVGGGELAQREAGADIEGESVPSEVSPACEALAAAGTPDAVASFSWRAEDLAACPDGGCVSGLTIEASANDLWQCTVKLERPGSVRTHFLSYADCRTARGWVSNASFLNVLRTGVGCEAGARQESFEMGAATSGPRSTNFCPEPTVEAVRGCLRGLVRPLAAADLFVGQYENEGPTPAGVPACEDLAADSVPDALGYFSWDQESSEGCSQGRPCSNAMGISSCTLTLIHDGSYRAEIEMAPADCVAARSWASNLHFMSVLRTGFGCDPGMRAERFDVTVAAPFSGPAASRDTGSCPEPTVEAVRTCMRRLATRLAGH